MKKLIYFLFAMALFSSCEKYELVEQPYQGSTTEGNLPAVIYATIDDGQKPQSRTYVATNKQVMWQTGDEVSFFYGNRQNARYAYNEEHPDTKVKLELKDHGTINDNQRLNKSRSIYPYDPNATIVNEDGVDKIKVTYPAVQTYALKSFGRGANLMVAAGNPGNALKFRNACGYLVIKLYGNTNVKNIKLSSVSGLEKISGKATIVTDENDIPTVTMSNEATTVATLDCSNGGQGVALSSDQENPTEFWFALPPVNFKNGIKIVVTDINDMLYTKQTDNPVNVTRNNIQPMAPLPFFSNTPASHKIWYTKTATAMAAADGKTPVKFVRGFESYGAIPFDATIINHAYDESAGKFVIEFNTPVKRIHNWAFIHNDEIETIELPDGLEEIGELAFGNLSNLKEITIPGSVNKIGSDVFYECRNMRSVTFLPSPTQTPLKIGHYLSTTIVGESEQGPFYKSPLTSIYLNRELVYTDESGNQFTPDEEDEGIFYYNNYDEISSVSVTIGGQVRTLSDYMFCGLKINHLTIPGNVTRIGNDVFNGCTALTSLTFEPSSTGAALSIGWNTSGEDEGLFVDCPLQTVNLNRQFSYAMASGDLDEDVVPFAEKSLGNGVTLGEQVRTLLPYMFSNSGITSLKIPGTVLEIKDNAFYDCTTLASVRFEGSATPLTIGFQPGSNERGPFYQSPLTSIYVNRELVATQSYAAARNQTDEGIFSTAFDDNVVKVTLQGNVNTISDYMFSGVQMQTIWIPREVTRICKGAFYDCSRLYGITLAHENPPTLEDGNAFYNTILDWIALEKGSDEKVLNAFKYAPVWNLYKDIIMAQIRN